MSDQNLLEQNGKSFHLYENSDLTFGKIKEYLNTAASIELKETKKTEGRNLMISYSVTEGRAKVLNNKSDSKMGGLTPEQYANKISTNDPAIKQIFIDALHTFEKAVQTLPNEQQVEIFGNNVDNFYEAEILEPASSTKINYDTKILVIKSNDPKVEKLKKVVSSAQEELEHDKYATQANAIKKLKSVTDKRTLNAAISKINTLLSNVNLLVKNDNLKLSDNSTIGEYMTARVYILVNSILHKGKINNFDPTAKKTITKRILGVTGISVKDISPKVSPEQLEFVNQNLLSHTSRKEILKTSILPLENIIKDFSLDMLKALESVMILDSQKENQGFKKEIQKAINDIHSSPRSEIMSVLKKEITNIKRIEKSNSAKQGFTFDYDGSNYNFGGSFDALSNLLSLLKNEKQQELNESKTIKQETIAVIPGSFKPPHKGHMAIAKAYSNLADKVIIMVSPMSRDMSNGQPVTQDISKNIWDMYLDGEGLKDKIKVVNSSFNRPSMAAQEFIMNQENNPDFAQPGQKIIIGSSTKDSDADDINDKSINFVRENVVIEFKSLKPLGKLDSKGMREAICKMNKKKLSEYLPQSINRKKATEQILSMFSKTQNLEENIIYDIITEHIVKKGNKYCLLSKKTNKNLGCYKNKEGAKKREKQVQYFKHAKEENMSGGSVQGATKPLGVESEKK